MYYFKCFVFEFCIVEQNARKLDVMVPHEARKKGVTVRER